MSYIHTPTCSETEVKDGELAMKHCSTFCTHIDVEAALLLKTKTTLTEKSHYEGGFHVTPRLGETGAGVIPSASMLQRDVSILSAEGKLDACCYKSLVAS